MINENIEKELLSGDKIIQRLQSEDISHISKATLKGLENNVRFLQFCHRQFKKIEQKYLRLSQKQLLFGSVIAVLLGIAMLYFAMKIESLTYYGYHADSTSYAYRRNKELNKEFSFWFMSGAIFTLSPLWLTGSYMLLKNQSTKYLKTLEEINQTVFKGS